ncbi:MAG: hypothetical protein ACRC42_05160, partial [Mycoplasma sp.]
HCDFSPLAGNCEMSAGFFQGTNDTVIKLIPLRDSKTIELTSSDVSKVYIFTGDTLVFEEDKEVLEVSTIDENGNINIVPFPEFTEYDGVNTLMIEIKGLDPDPDESTIVRVVRSNQIFYNVVKNKTYDNTKNTKSRKIAGISLHDRIATLEKQVADLTKKYSEV